MPPAGMPPVGRNKGARPKPPRHLRDKKAVPCDVSRKDGFIRVRKKAVDYLLSPLAKRLLRLAAVFLVNRPEATARSIAFCATM